MNPELREELINLTTNKFLLDDNGIVKLAEQYCLENPGDDDAMSIILYAFSKGFNTGVEEAIRRIDNFER